MGKKHSDLVYKTLVGVVGGIGPEATMDLCKRILRSQRHQFEALRSVAQGGGDIEAMHRETCESLSTANWSRDEVARLATYPNDIVDAMWDDQHCVPFLCYNASQIPDRTAWIVGEDGAADPRPKLRQAADGLVKGGATLLAVPCNTAHAFLPTLREAGAEVLHMPGPGPRLT